MKHIIKKILKEEIDSIYKKKLNRISDILIDTLKSNIEIDNLIDIDYDYIKNKFDLSDDITNFIYNDFIKKRTELSVEWLNEKIGNLRFVEIGDRIALVDEYNNKLIFYYKNSDKIHPIIYIRHEKIWIFLQNYFKLSYKEIQKILLEFLKKKYNIQGIRKANIHTVVNNPFLNSNL
jgi:hypothetical protein